MGEIRSLGAELATVARVAEMTVARNAGTAFRYRKARNPAWPHLVIPGEGGNLDISPREI